MSLPPRRRYREYVQTVLQILGYATVLFFFGMIWFLIFVPDLRIY